MPFKLSVEPLSSSSLPTSIDSLSTSTLIPDLVDQALSVLKKSESWPKGKLISTKEGKVQCRSGKSEMDGRLAKCGWHLRESSHPTSSGLDYSDFRNGLLLDHPRQEKEYMHGMTGIKQIQVLKEGIAEIWLNSYKMPIVTADRDFLELILTLDLPISKTPFSESHVKEIQQHFQSNPSPTLNSSNQVESKEDGLRSFLVISVPVKHEGAPDEKDYVRAMYASVEAIWETEERNVEWKMFVQSDSAGSIPLFLQEMAIPAKIAQDVPLFMGWKREQKIKAGSLKNENPNAMATQIQTNAEPSNQTSIETTKPGAAAPLVSESAKDAETPVEAIPQVPDQTGAQEEVEPESKTERDGLEQPGAADEVKKAQD